MRLALLGSDHEIQTLLRELPADSGHTIVAAFDANENTLPLGALLPHVERGDNWESLLVRDDIDLVIVAGPGTLRPTTDGMDPQVRRVDQLKKLAQAGVNLLVSHPAADLLDAYEIEMLRREGGRALAAWVPRMYHPAWEQFTPAMCREVDEPKNEVALDYYDHVDWERSIAGRSKSEVMQALSRDLFLIERMCGKAKRVTALASPGGSSAENQLAWHSLSVQIQTVTDVVIRWSANPMRDGLAARLKFSGVAGNWQFQIPIDRETPWKIEHDKIKETQTADGATWNEAVATLAVMDQWGRHRNNSDTWLEACSSLEALAAVEKSVQRSRTIELSQAEHSEEHNFKGVMASAGCLLLMFILFAIFVVVLVEGLQLPLRNSLVWRLWPMALFGALAVFLGLQFLQAVIQKPQQR